MKKTVLKRDPEKTKNSILAQATIQFARDGFHGTGLNEVCARAKVNKRMIYHYFKNKQELYRAVHLTGWEELQTWFTEKLLGSDPDQDSGQLLLQAISIFHDFIATHQIFVRLLMWDGLEGGTISRSLWKEVRGPIYHLVEDLILQAQKQGIVSKKLEANHLVISFMGAIAFYFSHAQTMVDIFHKQPLSPEVVEERKKQILLLLEQALRN